jgi:hypothetical protein
MLDLLLVPAALLVILAFQAVRRGDHRRHGHLMTMGFTLAALRMLLHPRAIPPWHLRAGLALLLLAGWTLALGHLALAWREGRGRSPAVPRLHRASGALTLLLAALATLFWLLRNRA